MISPVHGGDVQPRPNVTDTVATNYSYTLRNAILHGIERLPNTSTARRDAELLLIRVAVCNRAALLAYPDRVISADQWQTYQALLSRRAAAEPMQYILGEQEFYGLLFEVNRDVLIPRPETEHLVEVLLARVPHNGAMRIADVCTGSGAIAVALAHSLPQARIVALDNSPAALAVGRRNAERHKVHERIKFLHSDLLQALEGRLQFDAVVSNPPYISDAEQLESQVQDYEPSAALFAGPTGLEIYQRLIPQAARLVTPGGLLLLEIGAGQREAIAELLSSWSEVSFQNDLQGIPRVAIARCS